MNPPDAGWLAGCEKENAGVDDAAPKAAPKPPVDAALKENAPLAGAAGAPNAGADVAPKPNAGVLAGLAPKLVPKPPNVDALLADGLAPKPPNGELEGAAPKVGAGAPKGLGDGVPKGDTEEAGLAPKGELAGLAPKPPNVGVDAADAQVGREVALGSAHER